MRLGFRSRVGAAAAGSAALLLGALGFQYLGGIPPCHLCMDQRWVHVAALLVGIVAIITRRRSLAVIGSLIAVGSVMLAGYHVGVEQGVFAGPSSCTSDPVGSLGVDELYRRILAAPLIRCDEILWSLWGVSMAGWNMLASLGLAGLWMSAARSGRR